MEWGEYKPETEDPYMNREMLKKRRFEEMLGSSTQSSINFVSKILTCCK